MILSEKLRYLSYQDHARLQYGRLLWKNPKMKERLLGHWLDLRHPYRDRFQETYRPWVERVLSSDSASDEKLDQEFMREGESLRSIIKEIPPVFGAFY